MAGYSEKSLQQKLGITNRQSMLFLQAPKEYFATLGVLPKSVKLPHEKADFIHLFVTSRHELESFTQTVIRSLAIGGMLWVSWPKKSARSIIPSDITEQDLRDAFLPLGVVDVKVCTVTELWSGLKFVWRKS